MRLIKTIPTCTVRFGGGGLTVWCAMLYWITYEYRNKDGHSDIISYSALPSANLLGFAVNFVFQDDSVQPHRKNAVKQWKFC